MNITTVAVVASTNPVEVQAWFDDHPDTVIFAIWNNGSTFFIVYQ